MKRFYKIIQAHFLMLKEFKSEQHVYMILPAIDVSACKEELSASSYRTVLTILFYHFRHKKPASMLEDVNQGLKTFHKNASL